MIRFNSEKQRFEGVINGKVVVRGRETYVKDVLAKRYNYVENASVADTNVKKEYFSVDERFQFIEQFVGLVARKVIPSFIVTGDGGLGKTHTVVNTLKKLGKKELTIGEWEGDFVVVKGYSTAKGLYRTLWENNGKIIIFDDADSTFKDPIGANILKAALESSDKRVISWNAEFSDREELPNRFEFTGRVIFISNLTLAKFPQALISRSMKVDLTLNMEEKIDRIAHVFNEIKEDSGLKAEVLAFIKKNASQFTDLNVRSALSVIKLAKSVGQNWERIALYSAVA
jgi:hypothetical protein